MKRIVAGLMLGVAAACAPQPEVIAPNPVFRDTGAQIASQTDVTAARMAGDWVIRQRFASPQGPVGGLSLTELPDGALQVSILGGDCAQDTCFEVETLILLEPTGPGRWTPVNAGPWMSDREIWVMWMDFDSRTASLGTPSGEFGWIMDKNATGGRDRITAARDIMEWFGYNLSQLNEVVR